MITLERQGLNAEPMSRRLPEVRGGVCEHCGIIDPYVDSTQQYKLCAHYRGTQLRCSYCPPESNPDEVIRRSNINVAENPYKAGEWIAWCDSTNCANKHIERFRQNR